MSFIAFCCISSAIMAQQEKFPLTSQYSRGFINKAIRWDNSWINYPEYKDRDAWSKLPEQARKSIIKQGETYLGFTWPNIKATDYLLFTRTGDRTKVDDMNSQRDRAMNALLMAELVEGKGRFMDDLINGVYSTCQTTYWGSAAHFYLYGYKDGLDKPTTILPDIDNSIIDIYGSNTASTISWIYYFMHEEFDKVSPIISKRIKYEIKTKFLKPYYDRNDFWWMYGWNGEGSVNNWNLWCNLNMLNVILLMEDDPVKKLDGVYKNLYSVDIFINHYPEDGSCSEGPSYWGSAVGRLYTYLELLNKISDGKIDISKNEKIKEMGRYIYRVYIGDGVYFANYADAPIKRRQSPELIYKIGEVINDPVMKSFGAFLNTSSGSEDTSRRGRGGSSLESLFNPPIDWKDTKPIEPLIPEFYFPDLDMAIARDKQGTTDGFYFCAKGGSNGEQHNHNDVGSFMLYYNGNPVFIDVGPSTYTRETFGTMRYTIWTMQSNYHNLPVINGFGQQNGGSFKASKSTYTPDKNKVRFSTDISKAYPAEAKVNSWVRNYTLERGKKFLINDVYQLSENKGGSTVNFMTNVLCSIIKPGIMELKGDGFTLYMKYDTSLLKGKVEDIDIKDPKLSTGLGDRVSRLVFEILGDNLSGNFRFEISDIK